MISRTLDDTRYAYGQRYVVRQCKCEMTVIRHVTSRAPISTAWNYIWRLERRWLWLAKS